MGGAVERRRRGDDQALGHNGADRRLGCDERDGPEIRACREVDGDEAVLAGDEVHDTVGDDVPAQGRATEVTGPEPLTARAIKQFDRGRVRSAHHDKVVGDGGRFHAAELERGRSPHFLPVVPEGDDAVHAAGLVAVADDHPVGVDRRSAAVRATKGQLLDVVEVREVDLRHDPRVVGGHVGEAAVDGHPQASGALDVRPPGLCAVGNTDRPQQPGTADDDQLTIDGHDRLLIEAGEGGPPLGTVLERDGVQHAVTRDDEQRSGVHRPLRHDPGTQVDRLPRRLPRVRVDPDEVAAGCRDDHRAVDDERLALDRLGQWNIPEQVRLGGGPGAGRDPRPPVPALPRGHVEALGRHTGGRDGGCGRDRRGRGRLARSSVRLAGHHTQDHGEDGARPKGGSAGRRGGHGCACVRSLPPNDCRESSARRPEVRSHRSRGRSRPRARSRPRRSPRRAGRAARSQRAGNPRRRGHGTRARRRTACSSRARRPGLLRALPDTRRHRPLARPAAPKSWTEAAGASARRLTSRRRRSGDVRSSRSLSGPSRRSSRARRASTRMAGLRWTSRGRACRR